MCLGYAGSGIKQFAGTKQEDAMNRRLGLISFRALVFTMAAILLLAFLFATSGGLQSAPDEKITPQNTARGMLDGRRFKAGIVRIDENQGEKSKPLGDQLSFRNGMFSSEICKRYNFKEAPYWIRIDGEKTHFRAELYSPTDGKMLWKGTIQGNTLEGAMRWIKKRWYWTIDTEHKIRGELEMGSSKISKPPQ